MVILDYAPLGEIVGVVDLSGLVVFNLIILKSLKTAVISQWHIIPLIPAVRGIQKHPKRILALRECGENHNVTH